MNDGPLINQPSAAPTPKLIAGGSAGAALVILLWVAGLFGVDMPEPVAGAIVLLAALIAGYIKRDRANPGKHVAT